MSGKDVVPRRLTLVTEPAANGASDPYSLPFREFIRYAIETEQADHSGYQNWRSDLWEFTRLVKGWFPEDTKGNDPFAIVNREIRAMGGWESELGMSEEDAGRTFVLTWGKIRCSPGSSILEQALAKADAFPVRAPGHEKRPYPSPKYDRFVSLVGWLNHTYARGTFLLPVRPVAELLETDRNTVSQWRQLAIADGFLEKVAEHQFSSRGRGKATEFRLTEGFAAWFADYYSRRHSPG